MLEFFTVYRDQKSIGPTFNEAAAVLEEAKNVTVEVSRPQDSSFLIRTTCVNAGKLQQSLPGWRIARDVPGYPA